MTLIVKKDGDRRIIITDRPFETNDVVLKFQGTSLTKAQTDELSADLRDNALQIAGNNYLDLQGETASFIHHHCNPNCYIKAVVNSAFLIAQRPIAKGEEITFDYSLSSTETPDEWSVACNCHKYYCRKIISGFHSLPDEKKKEFEEKGIVPRYIKTG